MKLIIFTIDNFYFFEFIFRKSIEGNKKSRKYLKRFDRTQLERIQVYSLIFVELFKKFDKVTVFDEY